MIIDETMQIFNRLNALIEQIFEYIIVEVINYENIEENKRLYEKIFIETNDKVLDSLLDANIAIERCLLSFYERVDNTEELKNIAKRKTNKYITDNMFSMKKEVEQHIETLAGTIVEQEKEDVTYISLCKVYEKRVIEALDDVITIIGNAEI